MPTTHEPWHCDDCGHPVGTSPITWRPDGRWRCSPCDARVPTQHEPPPPPEDFGDKYRGDPRPPITGDDELRADNPRD